MKKTFIIAEIGINHNGDLNLAKKLIDTANIAGCDAVKFQKRTIEKVYTPEELDKYRESPWGTTNKQQKQGLEFGEEEFDEIDRYCNEKGIQWFASAWDPQSQLFLRQYDCKYNKVASAMLSIPEMLHMIAEERKHTFISTGMCTMSEIDDAVRIFRDNNCPFELMHCNSTYPMSNEKANLKMINTLKLRYSCDIGYSGHETGIQISLATVAMGATSLERHITLDRTMYGSDQVASLEPNGLNKLVRDTRVIDIAMGDGIKIINEEEIPIREKLSNPYWVKNKKSIVI